jgi:hypothetical protein
VNSVQQRRVPHAPWWIWPNLLGIDAPAVAVLWQYFFACNFRIKIPFSNYLTLFFVVWVIYSVDRLLDARMLKRPEEASLRHSFYHKNYRVASLITGALTILTAFLCLRFLPMELIKTGSFVGAFVVVYLLHQIWAKGLMMIIIPKEVFIGMVFAVGATLTGHTWSGDFFPDAFFSPSVIIFGILCSMNCIAISVWERGHDVENDPNALPQLLPIVVKLFPAIACTVFIVLMAYSSINHDHMGFPVFLASGIGCGLIAALSFFDGKFSSQFLRMAADMAVMVPALCYVFLRL